MRTRIYTAVVALAAVIGLGVTAALTAGSASAALENPALAGKRVLCVTSNGDFKALDAPCADHKDAAGKPMWFAGPLPVPGAAGYAESVKAIVGDATPGVDVTAIVKAEVAKQLAAAGVPKDDANETAPVLSVKGAVGSKQIVMQWTVPGPAADEKIASYVLQHREHNAVAWVEVKDIKSVYATTSNLDFDTSYDFRVRAEYVSGGNGPWSNVLTAKTAEA